MPHRPHANQLSLFDELEAAPLPPPTPAAALKSATPAVPAAAPAASPTAAPTASPSGTPRGPAQAPAAPAATPPMQPRAFVHPQAARELQLGEHRVAYALRRGRQRSIRFVVGAEGLSVSAPRWVSQRDIDAGLREKEGWILRKLHEAHQRQQRLQANRIEWREGAGIPFLGDTVILVLDPRCSGAVLNGDAQALPGVARLALHLGLPQGATPEQIRELAQSWLQRQARRIFEERCALFAARLGVRMRRLSLSSASTRWGSASADGSIRLNWRLVHFALPVIDYVVTHELAHLREMNHSPAFWDVVRQALPGYEQALGVLREQSLPSLD